MRRGSKAGNFCRNVNVKTGMRPDFAMYGCVRISTYIQKWNPFDQKRWLPAVDKELDKIYNLMVYTIIKTIIQNNEVVIIMYIKVDRRE